MDVSFDHGIAVVVHCDAGSIALHTGSLIGTQRVGPHLAIVLTILHKTSVIGHNARSRLKTRQNRARVVAIGNHGIGIVITGYAAGVGVNGLDRGHIDAVLNASVVMARYGTTIIKTRYAAICIDDEIAHGACCRDKAKESGIGARFASVDFSVLGLSHAIDDQTADAMAIAIISATKHMAHIVVGADTREAIAFFQIDVGGLPEIIASIVLSLHHAFVECDQIVNILNQIRVIFGTRAHETFWIHRFQTDEFARRATTGGSGHQHFA